MVDLGGIVNACSEYADTSAVNAALSNCVSYMVNGSDHPDATGLSIYYPLGASGSSTLKIFNDICFSPYYLSIVDMVSKGFTDELYSNDEFFDDEGTWTNDGTDNTDSEESSYFDYADEETTGESSLITFENEAAIDEDGVFSFKLDADGLEYATDVSAYIYMEDENGFLELGETLDVNGDWETGEFYDNFDGYWLSLPDGQLLPTYVADYGDDFIIYTSPIYVNGEETNLRIRQTDSGTTIEGTWAGIDENGAAAKNIIPLEAGDEITPMYYHYDDNDNEEIYEGETYVWNDGDDIIYAYLPEADYYYGFYIGDLYGDYYTTDYAIFGIDENGDIVFYTEE